MSVSETNDPLTSPLIEMMGHCSGRERLLDHDNLEEFADAVNYDREDTSDTGVAFYSALAQETGGPILELACGTGRVALPIAQLGFSVTGLDIVQGMLEQARCKSNGYPVQWVEGDARNFHLDAQFRLIFLTGNAFQAFITNADQSALLHRVSSHLHDEGLFAFETRNPQLNSDFKQGEGHFFTLESRAEENVGEPLINVDGNEVFISRSQLYDPLAQVLHVTTHKRWHTGGEERTLTTRIALRFTFPQELAALLDYHGFVLIRQFGDWNGEPLAATSPSIICVCQKRIVSE